MKRKLMQLQGRVSRDEMGNPWIQTYTGVYFDLIEPTVDMVRLEDIVWACSKQNRYTGHIRDYNRGQDYSVLEHQVLGTQTIRCPEEKELAFRFLMHDAHEAYCGDVSSPLKRALGSAWVELEDRISRVVREAFGLPADLGPRVKEIDMRMLQTERACLLGPSPSPWGTEGFEPFTLVQPRCWTPREARIHFMQTFERLKP